MKNKSIWQAENIEVNASESLKGNLKIDNLIIGGGISGMSIALELLEKNQSFALVEKGLVGMGITSRSTGKLTFAQGGVYTKIMHNYNFDTALTYYNSQKYAIKKAYQNIIKYDIDCDYEIVPSYIFASKESDVKKVKQEQHFYDLAKVEYVNIYSPLNNYPLKYGLEFKNTAIFNPLKYVLGLKKVIDKSPNKIYEHTKVLKIEKDKEGYLVKTDKANIYCKNVVVATHYPFFITPKFIPFRTYIDTSYILAAVKKVPKMSSITVSKDTISMRNYKDKYFLFATNSNLFPSRINFEANFHNLISKYQQHFKEKIAYIWSACDVMTNDSIPYIGLLKDKHIYIATGFNKWGMTNGILSGSIISDYIVGNKNPYASIFSFERKFSILKILNLLKNDFKTIITFITTKIIKNHKFYKHVKIKRINGQSVGIYTYKNKKYFVKNTCPHMKCSLTLNEVENTWDCPCHGSRFDINGTLITGPSLNDIKLDK